MKDKTIYKKGENAQKEGEGMKKEDSKKGLIRKTGVRIIICILLLLVGIGGFRMFTKMKKPPAEIVEKEKAIDVEVMVAKKKDAPVFIQGFGEIKSIDTVVISPEVTGKVVEIHPDLEKGKRIAKGELLFAIDPTDYDIAFREADATVKQMENAISRLKKQFETDRKRLKTLERNMNLAKADFQRIKRLFEKNRVGSKAGVDSAEQRYNSTIDIVDQMTQAIEIYPIRIRESESSLMAAKVRKEAAAVRLSRCEVKSPFNARVKDVFIEKDQYATQGQKALVLADDSRLEVIVPIDSGEALKWLRFEENRPDMNVSWFPKPEKTECMIRWTEAPDACTFKGYLDRVVEFNAKTRMVSVAVRFSGGEGTECAGRTLQLVDGMFCSVRIPGRGLRNVIAVPRWAVSYKNTVFTSKENRLKTVHVDIARIQGDWAYIQKGLEPEDLVIVTRLVDPLENSLLRLTEKKETVLESDVTLPERQS